MDREEFAKVAEEVLDSLPKEFRKRIRNVAVLVEDVPTGQALPEPGKPTRLLLACFMHERVRNQAFWSLCWR
jgi:predicted Zn-dependent protease with MMP-like domain